MNLTIGGLGGGGLGHEPGQVGLRRFQPQQRQAKRARLVLPPGMTLPADPVTGTMVTAPDGSATNAPNRLGGNMDAHQIRTGARVSAH